MEIRKVLHVSETDVNDILNMHRKAIDVCNIPEDEDIHLRLEEYECELSDEIKKLVRKAFDMGLLEGYKILN